MSENTPQNIRITTKEQQKIKKKLLEINKLLAKQDKETYTFSKLVHIVIENGIDKIKIDKNGKITI